MELFSTEVLAGIGVVAVILLFLLITGLCMAITLTYLMFRNAKVITLIHSKTSSLVLRILLLILDLLYMPAKKIILMLGGNDMMIDTVCVEIRNILLRNEFAQVPFKDRIVILPQCLRSLECPAKFSSVEGAQCVGCGKCKIFEITKKANELGYKGTYIAPGGGFVRRIIKKVKPKGVLGLGCPPEVNVGLIDVSSRGIPVQGVVLLKTGCVETDIDLNEVFEAMEIGGRKIDNTVIVTQVKEA
ncbi:MAG: DUF116 domain-containing protein [Candidatus Altiarchaeota archaeon]|nr:DUF116 domain-containing protein [Candidatus Altiarchaeota archaeon]